MKPRQDKGWSPYVPGPLSGVVLVLSVWIAGKFFGASTSFVHSAGMIEKLFSSQRVTQLDYFIKEVPKIEWQWMFVVGIFLGSLISAVSSASFRWQAIADMWESRFGPNRGRRAIHFTGRHCCHVWSQAGRWLT